MIYKIFWQRTQHIAVTCFIFLQMWKKTFWMHFKLNFWYIWYTWTCTGGSSFFSFTENYFIVFHLLFMIDFRMPHLNFKFLFWLFSECPCWWFLIKSIEENIHGYVLSCSVSKLDLFWKRFNSIRIQALLPKWIRFLHLHLST